jgi:TolB-like protein
MKAYARLWTVLSICLLVVSCSGKKPAPEASAQPGSQPQPVALETDGEKPDKKAGKTAASSYSIVIWDLDDMISRDMSQPELGELLASRVTETIQKSAAYTVIEREKLMAAQRELRLGNSPATDTAMRVRLSKSVGAQRMVMGGYRAEEGKMQLELRMIDVETGKTIKTSEQSAPATSITSWLDAVQKAAAALL